MTPGLFESNAKRCGLMPVFGKPGEPVTHWRGLDFYSAFDRHAYIQDIDGVLHGTLRDDDPLSNKHGEAYKPLADFTDVDFVDRLGMKPPVCIG